MNCTVLVGMPDPGARATTVAVKVTGWPNTEDAVLAERVVEVLAWLTCCTKPAEVLVAKLESPPYTAVMVRLPATTADVVKVATPDPFTVPVPSVVAPSLNVTVPVAVPAPGTVTVTDAIKVTVCPKVEGFSDEFVIVVVVNAWFTVCVRTAEVAPR